MTEPFGRQLVLAAEPPAEGARGGRTAFVARDVELAALREELHQSAVAGRAVVIGGDAGSGKSALLSTFLAEARRRRVTVVQGVCVEIESRRPFGAFADVVDSCVRLFGADRVEASLRERGVALRHFAASASAITAGSPARGDRYQMQSAFLGLVTDLSRDGAIVIALEDLHWADDASLELFGYLARRITARPVMVIATHRTDELDRRQPLRPLLSQLRSARLLTEIPLPALDLAGTSALVQARLGLRDLASPDAREFCELLHQLCEGSPLHIEETLDTLRHTSRLAYADNRWTCAVAGIRDALPLSVADSVVARWSTLTPAAQQILLVASVAGHRFDIETLAAVSGTPVSKLAPLMHEAIDVQLVRPEPDEKLAFRHALTREALRQRLLPSERRSLHAKIGDVIERGRATRPVPAAELAYHFDECGDRLRASRYHEEAATQAAASAAYPSAARSLERAIALAADDTIEQAHRQLLLARYLRLSGEDDRCVRAATAALEIGEQLADERVQGEALNRLALHYDEIYAEERNEKVLARALKILEPLGDTQELAQTCIWLAWAAAKRRDGPAMAAFAARAKRIAERLGLPAQLALAATTGALSLLFQGEWAQAAHAGRVAVEEARRAEEVDELYAALVNLRTLLVAADAPLDEQHETRDKVTEFAARHGLRNQDWIARALVDRYLRGDWDGFAKLLPELAESRPRQFRRMQLLTAFIALARSGPAAIPDLDEIRERAAAVGHNGVSAFWSAALLLVAGRPLDAIRFANTVRDEDIQRGDYNILPAARTHAIGLFAAMQLDDATALRRFSRSLAAPGAPPVLPGANRMHLALANAQIAEHEGRFDAAIVEYANVLSECEREQAIEASTVYIGTLCRLRRAGLFLHKSVPDRSAAQAELDAALPFWREAKATWYLEQLRGWAVAAGLTFRKAEEVSGAAPLRGRQLTRREDEVARLVAQGLTNKEIAKRLTLSVRTAESHVDEIRSKLGFRTRSQIAAWVAQRYGAAR